MYGNQASGFTCPSCNSDGPHFIAGYDMLDGISIALKCKCEASWWEILHEDG